MSLAILSPEGWVGLRLGRATDLAIISRVLSRNSGNIDMGRSFSGLVSPVNVVRFCTLVPRGHVFEFLPLRPPSG